MADVDWDLMERWMTSADLDQYELLFVEFPIAEEHLERWCEILLAMNTAPREALEFDDFTMTPAKWRENERAILGRGQTLIAYVARHRATGQFAAMTDVILRHHQPEHADQDDTVTHPDHRGRGLGRLIKAAMIRYLAETHPEIDHIDTGNAGSNAAMLKINVEMGYRPILMINAWQGDIEVARDALARQRA
jgi:GNAT superfamily N-acetyltransferase